MLGKRNHLHHHPVDEEPPNPESSDDEDVAPPAQLRRYVLVNPQRRRLILVNLQRLDEEDEKLDRLSRRLGGIELLVPVYAPTSRRLKTFTLTKTHGTQTFLRPYIIYRLGTLKIKYEVVRKTSNIKNS
jgi:hypothetical protein